MAFKGKLYLQIGNQVEEAPVRAVTGFLGLQVTLALPNPHVPEWVFLAQGRTNETQE